MKRPVRHAVFPDRATLPSIAAGIPVGYAPVVAHQGGWDEILLVVAPLAVIGGLLWLANRRVTAQLENEIRAEGDGRGPADSSVADSEPGRQSSGDHGQD